MTVGELIARLWQLDLGLEVWTHNGGATLEDQYARVVSVGLGGVDEAVIYVEPGPS